ncbi:MAG: mitochondrial fission ELM1 family protein [Rhodospirillales bacterium]
MTRPTPEQSTGAVAPNGGQSCWVITEGAAGMENQCLGLADALGLDATVYRPPKPLLHGIVPGRWLGAAKLAQRLRASRQCSGTASSTASGEAVLDYPDIAISCGHKSVAYAIALRRMSQGRTLTVHIQNPHTSRALFDLVFAPAHDRLEGANVSATAGALHRVTARRLHDARQHFSDRYANLPRPIITALIGGASRRYRLDADAARAIGSELAKLVATHNGSLLVTTSRRTAPDAAASLRQALADIPGEIWDGTGDNPYFGYLALADHIAVTCDSVTMTSEACATGKPVHIIRLKGRGSRRFDQFFSDFVAAGYVRWFTGALDAWQYDPPQETARAAEIIRRRLAGHAPDL